MCDAGRIKHHLKYNLWRPECTVLFVGYQSVGTPGRRIVDGTDEIRIFGEPVAVRAEIEVLQGLSGHADKAGLIDWIEGFTAQKPSKVFIVHGEDEAAMSFAKCLREEHGFDADAPYSGTVFNLAEGEYEKVTEGVRIHRKGEGGYVDDMPESGKKRQASSSYTQVRIAEKELSKVIEEGTGLPNRELEELAGELRALAKKYRITG